MLCICMAISLAGCKSKLQSLSIADIKDETFLLRSDGSVQSAAYEEFDNYYYREEELEEFMENTIESYNEQQGENVVELTKFKVEEDADGKNYAAAIFTYDSLAVYCEMNGVEAQTYTMKEAKAKGILPTTFTVASDGSKTAQKEVSANEDYKVLAISIKADVYLPSTIKYYTNAMILSSNSVETTGEDVAVIVYK